MKLTSKVLIITISMFITFCGSPVDNNSDGSYEEKLVGEWDRISFSTIVIDTNGDTTLNSTSNDEYQFPLYNYERSKYFPKAEENQTMWWEASKDTIYLWYVNSEKLNRNDVFNKFYYTLKNDTLKIFYVDSPATDSTGSEYGRVISKSFFRR